MRVSKKNPKSVGESTKCAALKGTPRCERLRIGDLVVPRFALNQPHSKLGLKPGCFRNTFSGQEYECLRTNVLLWRRGRVYFQDGQDVLPTCKSNNGLKPSPLIQTPKHGACGGWDANGWFVPECPLATWRFYDGRRCAPLCQETWNLLAVAEDSDMPFWISLKGGSLRSARQFLSLCHEVSRTAQRELLECTITLSAHLVTGRSFEYFVVRFSDPQWLARTDARHKKLTRLSKQFGHADIQATFDAEQGPAPDAAVAG